MTDETQFPPMPGAALLYVECDSGVIGYSNPMAQQMLGQSAVQLQGATCWDALGVAPGAGQPLAEAIRAGNRTALSPMRLCPPGRDELVVGGYLFAQQFQGRDTAALLLFPLATGQDPVFARPLAEGDVVAVLGLDVSAAPAGRGPEDIARLMIDIRFGLTQIVPAREDVGVPVGATIPVALRDTTIEQARDVSAALLSHLSPLLVEGSRVLIGLARNSDSQSPLATLLAANAALLRLQSSHSGELIAVAADGAPGAMAGSAEGIFGAGFRRGESSAYLAGLATLAADPQHADDYLSAVLALTLGQRGVCAAAIYRRDYDGSLGYAAGAVKEARGLVVSAEKQLPRGLRQLVRKVTARQLEQFDRIVGPDASCAAYPLRRHQRLLGHLVLQYDAADGGGFAPDAAALHHLGTELSGLAGWDQSGSPEAPAQAIAPRGIDERIDGYVGDNMEGAIDQAVFLSRLDVPVAVIGPRGTGKLYVAKVIHQESGAAPEQLVVIDCREFRSRRDALNRIARELERSAGKTLVFKSPHLMNPDAQLKLAKQVSSRILADTSPPRYLPAARIIALFPDSLEHLVRYGGLNDRLASVFAGYPIRVPPIKDRKRAVLRWSHKILSQEAARRDRKVSGFTPDAEQAMLQHDWPGNISEMRQCILNALDKTDKEWLTPVDLGIFKGLSASGPGRVAHKRAYLQVLTEPEPPETAYVPTSLEELGVALGEALHGMLEQDTIKPLGAWLEDEVILAACERFRDNLRAAAEFLQTRPRNIGRWMPKVLSRDHERSSSSLWQTPRSLVRQWIMETAPGGEPPQQLVQATLMAHVIGQCGHIKVADRARIMGVSTPTYLKRLQDSFEQSAGEPGDGGETGAG